MKFNAAFLTPSSLLASILCLTPGLICGSAAAASDFPSLSSKKERCELELLKDLGWKFEKAPLKGTDSLTLQKFEISEGDEVCQMESARGAHDKGALSVKLAEDATDADYEKLSDEFPRLLKSRASFCGYKFKVGQAAETATQKISANKKLRFKILPIGGFLSLSGGEDDLENKSFDEVKGTLTTRYIPKTDQKDGIRQFYSGRGRTDCAGGLQAALSATTYELFGADGYKRAFTPEEMSIGDYDELQLSENIFFGKNKKTRLFDRYAEKLSQQGAASLVGVSGYIGNVFGEKFLRNKPSRGENFLIVSVSPAAASALYDQGSLDPMSETMRKAWDIVRAAKSPLSEAKKLKKDEWNHQSDQEKTQVQRDVDELLSGPEFTEIMIWVHPLGLVNIRYFVKRLMRVNPRTPYEIYLYSTPMNSEIYERYKAERMRSCMEK